MTHLAHDEAQETLRHLFESGAAPGRTAPLFAHLAECERCRVIYNRLATLEAALCGAHPTTRSHARVRAAVLERCAPRRRPRLAWLVTAGSLLLSSAAAAAVLLAMQSDPRPERGGGGGGARVGVADADSDNGAGLVPGVGGTLAARGTPAAPGERTGLRTYVLGRDGIRPVTDAAIPLREGLAFTYTNLAPELRYVMVLGVQGDGATRWYVPDYGAAASVPIATDRVDEPLDQAVRLIVNHRPGPLRVIALFSAAPIATAAVEARVRQLGQDVMTQTTVMTGGAPADGAGTSREAVVEHSAFVRLAGPTP